jgi:hypothetical protein
MLFYNLSLSLQDEWSSNFLSFDLVIFGVSSNESNVPNPVWVIELDDHSILVARYVEYDSIISQYARVPVHGFDLVRCSPISGPGFLIPGFNWLFSIRVNLPEDT